MWGFKERLSVSDAYVQSKRFIEEGSARAIAAIVETSGRSFLLDPDRFSMRGLQFRLNWTYGVFSEAALQGHQLSEDLCRFALGRQRGDMITGKPLRDFLSSSAPMATTTRQHELVRSIFDCSFNGEWPRGGPTIVTRNVPLAGAVADEFSAGLRHIKDIGERFHLTW